MKTLFSFLAILFLLFLNISSSFAFSNTITIVPTNEKQLTREDLLNYFGDSISSKIPKSYTYINLNIPDVPKTSKLYSSLQKLIFLDLIDNSKSKILPSKLLTEYEFYKISEKILKVDIIDEAKDPSLKTNKATISYLKNLEEIIAARQNSYSDVLDSSKETRNVEFKKQIFWDVYKTLLTEHYNHSTLDKWKMLDSAIEWLAKWTWDKFTSYFPPTESKNFMDSLNWDFEWIWAYVEMTNPWELKIISPISWSPSEKAWLKWWDVVIKINWKEITKDNSLEELVSWIKWPSWTKVKLTIKRWEQISDFEVTRDKIVIKNVEYSQLDSQTFYIKIVSFWDHVSSDFKKSLEELKKKTATKKVIIDLRNNPGWYLEQVSDMLWFFVPEWEKVAVVKNTVRIPDTYYFSSWYNLIDFSKYKIIILQNSGSASASEIMIWTIKDYFPATTLIWETTYWKGSVQTVKEYTDWSSLKYTIAKWFTWKTETWIDGVGIKADVILPFDFANFEKNWKDNQLEKAKSM